MTGNRLRIVSSGQSGIRSLALAVACAALVVPSISAEAADLVVWWQDDFLLAE